jgi:hypothetical protein
MTFGYNNYKESGDKSFSSHNDARDGQTQDNDDPWRKSYLIDRLKQHLATFEESDPDNFDPRKYYNRAHHHLKAAAFDPVPPYIVYLSDLSKTPRLVKELQELDRADRAYVLRQAIGRILEDVNFDLYYNSISRVLKVELQP